MLALIKIRALAVDPNAQGQGIGAALLHRCVHLYFRLGYYLAYGSFRTDTGLEHYYSRLGFTIADPGQGVSLSMQLGLPFGVSPEPGERLFSCRPRARPLPGRIDHQDASGL